MWREIKKKINKYERFAITTHIHPDGDGIGSATALIELLIQMGKKAIFLSPTSIASKFEFLDFHGLHEVFQESKDYRDIDMLIVVDTHKKNRIGPVTKLLDNPSLEVVCIDHHHINEPLSSNYVIDSKSCCVGAMIYTLYKECGYPLNLNAATGIYTSVICDTGRFSYASTSRKAHKIADECIKVGVDPDLMHSQLFQNVSLAEFAVFRKALQRVEFYFDHRVIIQRILCRDYEETGVAIEDLEYIHEFSKSLENIECTVVLRELSPKKTRVSIRSNGYLNTVQLLRSMGGGGHRKAAGVICKESVEKVKQKVLLLLEDYFSKEDESYPEASYR